MANNVSNDLLLFLRIEKKLVSPGNLPEAVVVLTNEGRKELLVNARLLAVPEGYPETIGEIIFLIDGPAESVNLKDFSVNAGRAKAHDFARLKPGETLLKTYDLNKYFRFTDPGTYTTHVIYRSVIDLTLDGMLSWKGHLKSNDENFEIQV